MANQVYEQLAEMKATCKKCEPETEYKISYAVTMSAGQGPATHTFECVKCGEPFDVEVPGPILEGPDVVTQNK